MVLSNMVFKPQSIEETEIDISNITFINGVHFLLTSLKVEWWLRYMKLASGQLTAIRYFSLLMDFIKKILEAMQAN